MTEEIEIAEKCLEGNTETSKQFLDDGKKAKSWCFTSFEEEAPIFISDKMRYLCYSPEVCPTTGRKHFQGYFYLENDMTLKAIKKKINGKWKLIRCVGSSAQNRIYCGAEDYEKDGKIKKKNPDFKEFGDCPSQGRRTDLMNLKNDILNNITTVDKITLSDPMMYHQYGRTLEKIENIHNHRKFRMLDKLPDCVWYYGATGVGKSHKCFEGYNPETHYLLNPKDSGFWQGYKLQKILLINEFRGEIPFGELLNICDKWPLNVKVKGEDTKPCMVEKVIITSPKHPEQIYNKSLDDSDNIDQFLRRFRIEKLEKNEL